MFASLTRNTWAVWVSLGTFVVGLALAQYGTYNLRRWGRSPRPDEVIEAAMKGFDDRYHYYAWSLPQPYVLLSPNGVYNFVTRDQRGAVSVTGSQWHSKFSLSRLLLFAQEGLGNPTREALDGAEKLRQWILQHEPDLDAPVQPAIVFIDPRVELTVADPTVPVLQPKDIKKWLRGTGKGAPLSANNYRRLEALFNAQASGEQHTVAKSAEGENAE
jgi:hypothetical protein